MVGPIHLPFIKVIPDHWLPALRKYQAVGEDASLIRRHVTNPFYEWLMQHVVPDTIAPNTITLIGFSLLLGSAALISLYGDYFDDDVPRILFLVCAVCLFIYQTLDNLDGKQARRTGSSSPLGEILDHGCDALGCTIGGVAHVMAAVPGTNTVFIYAIALSAMAFATWEEYYAGGMFLGPLNGPNEALFFIMFGNILTAIMGQTWMTTPLSAIMAGSSSLPTLIGSLSPSELINYGGLIATIITASTNIKNVIHHSRVGRHKHGIGLALLGLLPFLIAMGTYAVWIKAGTIFYAHPHMFVCAMGVSFAYYNSNITLSYILGSRLKTFDGLCLAHLLALANVLLNGVFQAEILLSETTTFYLLFVVVAVVYGNFVISVINQVSNYLKIPVLSLPEKKIVESQRQQEREEEESGSTRGK